MSRLGSTRQGLKTVCELARSRRGVAALELALFAPILVALLGAFVDFGMLIDDQRAVTDAIASVDNYAFVAMNAGQSATAVQSSSVTMAASLLAALTSAGSITTVSFNNGSGASTRCCPRPPGGGAWTCGVTSCSDGADPGIYLNVTVTLAFHPLFPEDGFLAGSYARTAAVRVL